MQLVQFLLQKLNLPAYGLLPVQFLMRLLLRRLGLILHFIKFQGPVKHRFHQFRPSGNGILPQNGKFLLIADMKNS